ncbi:MAG: hypothetical protein JRJ57_11785 [Deltaproteobacteria bacterium]|nr:hypothetical protein [Deltaproteobacteria bacterium]MBW2105030.1 hypothetical protein [Deltaproteobacteria bacterium]
MSLFDFKNKQKSSSEQFGKLLAEIFSKHIIEDFEEKILPWLTKMANNSDKTTLLREWIFFEMFLMVNAVTAYFKGSNKCFQILDFFNQFCGENFKHLGIFNEDLDFLSLLKSRYVSYSNALKETQPPGELHWVSKKLISNLKGNDKDIANIMSVASYYTNISIANKNFINGLIENFKITD